MASNLTRPLSVHFSTKFLKRLSHEEVIYALDGIITTSNIRAIQITEKECIITVNSAQTKTNLIIADIRIQNRIVNITDVEKIITNVTIKDAPFEMPNSTVLAQLSQYGDIIAGSISRAKIKGTDIENGTRYVKVINCVPVLPLSVEIGRFTLRMFADNNRTPCKHCGITSHPYFKCPNNKRSTKQNLYWNCQSSDHVLLAHDNKAEAKNSNSK